MAGIQAVSEKKRVAEIAKEYGISPGIMAEWKDPLRRNMGRSCSDLFKNP